MNEHIENLRQQINKAVRHDVTICEKQDPKVLIKFTYTTFNGKIVNGHVGNHGLIVLANSEIFLGLVSQFNKAAIKTALREGGYYGDQDVLIINDRPRLDASKLIKFNTVYSYALISHPTTPGLYLSISTKDAPNDFILPGGEVHIDDCYYGQVAVRKTLEDTGYQVTLDGITFSQMEPVRSNKVITYRGCLQCPEDIHSDIRPSTHSNTSVIKWLPASELIKGSFSEYNKVMFEHFGIPIE